MVAHHFHVHRTQRNNVLSTDQTANGLSQGRNPTTVASCRCRESTDRAEQGNMQRDWGHRTHCPGPIPTPGVGECGALGGPFRDLPSLMRSQRPVFRGVGRGRPKYMRPKMIQNGQRHLSVPALWHRQRCGTPARPSSHRRQSRGTSANLHSFKPQSHWPCPTAFPPPPLCDLSSFVDFLIGPWTVTRSSLGRVRRVIVVCSAVGPVRVVLLVCAWGPVLSLRRLWLALRALSCIVRPQPCCCSAIPPYFGS